MSDDLRRLAEQAIAADPLSGFTSERAAFRRAATPQAILELLDERDLYRNLAGLYDDTPAERRVAALEEGLRAQRPDDSVDCWCRWPLAQPEDHSDHCKQARALLASEASDD